MPTIPAELLDIDMEDLRPAVVVRPGEQPAFWLPLRRARGVARPCVHGATWQSAPAGRRRATMVGDDVVGSSDGR
jgi:hypothetical protein